MRNKFAGTACAGLLALGMSSAADAAIVTMDFTGNGSYANYEFDIQRFDYGEFIEYNLELTSANINGTAYDSSSYTFMIKGFELTDLVVIDSNDLVVSNLTFEGYFDAQNGTLNMNYYGDGNTYSGTSYSFDSVNDFYTGEPLPMLYDQMDGSFGMTSVSVNTISAVPVPAAVWLFGSGLIGLAGIARRRA